MGLFLRVFFLGGRVLCFQHSTTDCLEIYVSEMTCIVLCMILNSVD